MNNNEQFDSQLTSELFGTFEIDNEVASELEATSSDNFTPAIFFAATVTGAVEC